MVRVHFYGCGFQNENDAFSEDGAVVYGAGTYRHRAVHHPAAGSLGRVLEGMGFCLPDAEVNERNQGDADSRAKRFCVVQKFTN